MSTTSSAVPERPPDRQLTSRLTERVCIFQRPSMRTKGQLEGEMDSDVAQLGQTMLCISV
jgi:hypothetical protein